MALSTLVHENLKVRHTQSDTMEVLDEKTNGAPPMEVEEIVSVRDRMVFLLFWFVSTLLKDYYLAL